MVTLHERREIKKIAKSRPAGHGLPCSTWSLVQPADFLVAEGWSMTSATRACASCSAKRRRAVNWAAMRLSQELLVGV
jgi:hypothetical protein